MSWEITQKDGQYRIWSTISDTWLTDWIDRREAIRFYYDHALMDFKKRIIEEFYKFPHMWTDHDSNSCNRIDDEEGYRRYIEWLELLNSSMKDSKTYYKLVDEIYDRIMKALDIEDKP